MTLPDDLPATCSAALAAALLVVLFAAGSLHAASLSPLGDDAADLAAGPIAPASNAPAPLAGGTMSLGHPQPLVETAVVTEAPLRQLIRVDPLGNQNRLTASDE